MTQAAVEQEARLSVVVPADLKAEVEALARERERSVSAEIRVALREHLTASHALASVNGIDRRVTGGDVIAEPVPERRE